MEKLIGLKEWSAVVDALGQGIQTVLVRGYEPKVNRFFLYPTFSYFVNSVDDNDKFNGLFQQSYRKMAKDSGENTVRRSKQELLLDVQYYCEIDQCYWIDEPKLWRELEPYYIWTSKHVIDYASKTRTQAAYLWLVRTHRLKDTHTIGRVNIGGPPRYYEYPQDLPTQSAIPVLSDTDYGRVKNKIQTIVKSAVAVTLSLGMQHLTTSSYD